MLKIFSKNICKIHIIITCILHVLFIGFSFHLLADDSTDSSDYRERFRKDLSPKREEPLGEGKGDGFGGSPKRGKFGKKKKKKDDFRRVVGGSRDPVVPVTGVETGDLTAVTYKSPTPSAPLLEKAWNSTAWAPTYQPAGRSLLGEKGDLSSVIQSDLIKHTGWQVDGDSISVSPDLNGGPYDVQTGQAIAFAADHEGGTSVDLLGILGIPRQVASALTWDSPFSVFGPNNPFLLVRKNPLKNPLGIVQSGRRLANHAGVLSAWAFGEGGVQITEDGGIGIVHDPSGGEALWAGAGIALWFTPIKAFRPVLSAGARALPRAAQAWRTATALGRGAWGRVTNTANQFGHWAVGATGRLGHSIWGGMEAIARASHSSGMMGGGAINELFRFTGRLLARADAGGNFLYRYALKWVYEKRLTWGWLNRIETRLLYKDGTVPKFNWSWLYSPGWLARQYARQRAIYNLACQLPSRLSHLHPGDHIIINITDPTRRMIIFFHRGYRSSQLYHFVDAPGKGLGGLRQESAVGVANFPVATGTYLVHLRTGNFIDDIMQLMIKISGYSQREVRASLAVFSKDHPVPLWWLPMLRYRKSS